MKIDFLEIGDRFVCPKCGFELRTKDNHLFCGSPSCPHNQTGFPSVDECPVLIDFETSIVDSAAFSSRQAASPIGRNPKGWKSFVKRVLFGTNRTAAKNETYFLHHLREKVDSPLCLVIGGGEEGSGVSQLYTDSNVRVVGTDIYHSPLVTFIADAHKIPLASSSVDGVWIQAVLEHVLDPWMVVREIHRVLKDDGLVYAETPFMQQVHEEGYDFVRFTHSGHRWLFRHFEEIRSGTVGGPGTQLLWTLDYFTRAVFRSPLAGKIVKTIFFPLRLFDVFGGTPFSVDTSPGVYFLGLKSQDPLEPHQMPSYFRGYRKPAKSKST